MGRFFAENNVQDDVVSLADTDTVNSNIADQEIETVDEISEFCGRERNRK